MFMAKYLFERELKTLRETFVLLNLGRMWRNEESAMWKSYLCQ